ncbi:MAG: chromosome segregation protein SMC [Oscillospiraceae bacterium]|nr:chromosome segregation protein SMC [Oscillospiraceae bacterium]
MIALYLKSLEIQGFKSFPEKTRLSFDKPITGIVGPNGSGKSNISDAILWVMGEQSTRTLRSGKMEDVIFSGTQRRAQVGYAEVSLVLDNSDGSLSIDSPEVTLTRRYYRSGESEYYINRAMVRLKDVNEILMDTGLGREGYSVLGQGRIADVLSTKSRDRRDIFEEAAGISRFRHRKEESEHKLALAEENLLRLGDKISELELQIEPLREQAEKAKKYLILRDELRGLEISMWVRDLDSLRLRAEKTEADLASARIALETVTREVDAAYSGIDEASENTRRCDVDLESVRDSLSASEAELNDAESAVAVLSSQIEGNAEQILRLDEDIRSRESSSDSVGAQIVGHEERLSEIEVEKNELDAKGKGLLEELQSITGAAGKRADELSALLRTEGELGTALSNGKAALSALASQAQELYDRERSLEQELSQAALAHEVKKADLAEASAALEKTREEAESLGNVISGLEIKADNRIKKAELSRENLDRVNHELRTLESRRTLLAEMEKDYKGYSNAVKLIMQESARGAVRNIRGTVGSLLKAGDRHAAAIEMALGGAIQNIVVDTEEDGKSAINYLKRRDGGRATFLPLTNIKGNVLSESDVGDDPGFEGIAYNLVSFDPEYKGVYASLLGRVIIADDLNSAVRIAKKNGYRYKTVTLDGQVVNAGGSMTGGSTAGSAGVLSRANELDVVSEKLATYAVEVKQAEREHAECVRNMNAAQYELDTARAEMSAAREKLIRQEGDASYKQQLLDSSDELIASLREELKAIDGRMASNASDTEAARAGIASIESETAAHRIAVEEALSGQEDLSRERERVNAAIADLRADGASLDSAREVILKTISELNAVRSEMSGDRERRRTTIESLKKRNDEIQAEIALKLRDAEEKKAEIAKLRERISALNARRMEVEAIRVELNKKLQDKNQEQLNLQRECSRLEQNKSVAELEEKQIVDKLWDTYEISRTLAATAGAQIDDPAAAQKRITAIKRQISDLGEPNIGAIEEFERVNERYSYLSSQQEDVDKACIELRTLIAEITAQMKGIFIREFEAINEGFAMTFRELFGGGRASLALEDPEDVLECGIDIQVQPPGKSLRNIMLLSGGEKAFVAIAIYFAILTVRPPPFVVMDEIESALDEANVMRFAEHMRRMSANTQLIVITHRRATMEEADVLFGVTMQELGVSSMISVDVAEAEKHMTGAIQTKETII